MSPVRDTHKKRNLQESLAWYVPVTDALLNEITQRIVQECNPEQITLFGSHSNPAANRDLDPNRDGDSHCNCYSNFHPNANGDQCTHILQLTPSPPSP